MWMLTGSRNGQVLPKVTVLTALAWVSLRRGFISATRDSRYNNQKYWAACIHIHTL